MQKRGIFTHYNLSHVEAVIPGERNILLPNPLRQGGGHFVYKGNDSHLGFGVSGPDGNESRVRWALEKHIIRKIIGTSTYIEAKKFEDDVVSGILFEELPHLTEFDQKVLRKIGDKQVEMKSLAGKNDFFYPLQDHSNHFSSVS